MLEFLFVVYLVVGMYVLFTYTLLIRTIVEEKDIARYKGDTLLIIVFFPSLITLIFYLTIIALIANSRNSLKKSPGGTWKKMKKWWTTRVEF